MLPGLFADAAERAFAAGFDGVELHYAHAYTMASFLSALNTRDDGYGGPREHRVRLPLEVIAAVRARVGAERVVGCRFLGDDVVEGGNRVDDAAWFGGRARRAPGLDFLSVSKGGKFEDAKQPKVGRAAYPYTGPSGYECMPTVFSDAARPVRAQRRARRPRSARAVREAGLDHAGRRRRRHLRRSSRPRRCSRAARPTSSRRRARRLADPDWFLKMRARPRRRDPPLRVHQLLRGARPAAQAGHLQAVGSRRARRAGRDARRDRASAGCSPPRWTPGGPT